MSKRAARAVVEGIRERRVQNRTLPYPPSNKRVKKLEKEYNVERISEEEEAILKKDFKFQNRQDATTRYYGVGHFTITEIDGVIVKTSRKFNYAVRMDEAKGDDLWDLLTCSDKVRKFYRNVNSATDYDDYVNNIK